MNKVIQHLRQSALKPDAEPTDRQLLECFVKGRENSALETLVWRHGSLVWGVCRRILRNYHDAEDAFQATFLVLVRKASGAADALRAIGKLADDPQRTPAFVKAKLRDVSYPSADEIRTLLAQLDSEDFRVRDEAKKKLLASGKAIEPALRQAHAADKSLEFQRRVLSILEELQPLPVPAALLQCQRAVQVLEMIGTSETRTILQELERKGVAEASGALSRLARRN